VRFEPVVWSPDVEEFRELSDLLALFEPSVHYEILVATWPPEEDAERLVPVIARLKARALEDADIA
jgi:hypothetical protein